MLQLTEQEKFQIIQSHLNGESIDSLRARFKRGPVTIERVLVDAGIEVKKGRNGTSMSLQLEKKIVDLFNEGNNPSEIARSLGISSATTVQNKLRLLGLYETRFPNINEEQKAQINSLYSEGLPSQKIAKQLGISKWAVLKFIEGKKRERFDYRTYDVDREFFDNIDTQEKAYWLGVMFSDGYNCEDTTYIRLAQAEINKELVYSFKQALRAGHPVNFTDGQRKFYQITISNERLSKSLAKHGCVQAKTHITKYPEIDLSLDSHFIRGYFDGDGSIHTCSGNPHISITGNKDLIEVIQNKLIESCGLNKTKLICRRPETSPNIVEIRYGGKNQVKRISEYLYKDATCYMQRKFEKFFEIN